MKIYFVTGIGTDVGKTYVTAWLLRQLIDRGSRASSFKLVQTGMQSGVAPDIIAHREGSNQPLSSADYQGLSCGAQFTYPASPHLAATLEQQTITSDKLWQRLQQYIHSRPDELILCEGAGGVFVPLNTTLLTADWIKAYQLPVILVCNAALGSLHQTIATLEAMDARDIAPQYLIYNPHPATNPIISHNSEQWLADYLARHYPTMVFFSLNQYENLPHALYNKLIA